jgi:hypothetical protein
MSDYVGYRTLYEDSFGNTITIGNDRDEYIDGIFCTMRGNQLYIREDIEVYSLKYIYDDLTESRPCRMFSKVDVRFYPNDDEHELLRENIRNFQLYAWFLLQSESVRQRNQFPMSNDIEVVMNYFDRETPKNLNIHYWIGQKSWNSIRNL